jgi:intracellular multiplication protein IcmE
MANENDASRDKKLLVGLIALVCAGAAGGGYLVWNHFLPHHRRLPVSM